MNIKLSIFLITFSLFTGTAFGARKIAPEENDSKPSTRVVWHDDDQGSKEIKEDKESKNKGPKIKYEKSFPETYKFLLKILGPQKKVPGKELSKVIQNGIPSALLMNIMKFLESSPCKFNGVLDQGSSIDYLIKLSSGNFATLSSTDFLIIWNGDTYKEIKYFNKAGFRFIAPLRNDKIACAMFDNSILILDTTNNKYIRTERQNREIKKIIELDNGNILSLTEDGETIKIWDKDSGDCLKTIISTDPIHCIVQGDENTLVIGTSEKMLEFLDIKTGKSKFCLKFATKISHLLKLKNGNILCGSYHGIVIWDIRKKQPISFPDVLNECYEFVSILELENGEIVVALANNKIVKWNLNHEESIPEIMFRGDSNIVEMIDLEDGRIAVAYGDATIRTHHIKTKKSSLIYFNGPLSIVSTMVKLKNGTLAVSWQFFEQIGLFSPVIDIQPYKIRKVIKVDEIATPSDSGCCLIS